MTLISWITFVTFGFVWMASSYTVMLLFANICLGGFYPANATPVERPSAVYRAQFIFQEMALIMFIIADVTILVLGVVVSKASWETLVWPALPGVGFTIVYSIAKLTDRVRAR